MDSSSHHGFILAKPEILGNRGKTTNPRESKQNQKSSGIEAKPGIETRFFDYAGDRLFEKKTSKSRLGSETTPKQAGTPKTVFSAKFHPKSGQKINGPNAPLSLHVVALFVARRSHIGR